MHPAAQENHYGISMETLNFDTRLRDDLFFGLHEYIQCFKTAPMHVHACCALCGCSPVFMLSECKGVVDATCVAMRICALLVLVAERASHVLSSRVANVLPDV